MGTNAHELTLACYKATKIFPREETYGLSSQLRRASSSIAANIGEGCGRSNNGDFSRFLQIAMGSASEVEYELMLAYDLGYVEAEHYNVLCNRAIEVKKILLSLSRKVEVARFQDRGERL